MGEEFWVDDDGEEEWNIGNCDRCGRVRHFGACNVDLPCSECSGTGSLDSLSSDGAASHLCRACSGYGVALAHRALCIDCLREGVQRTPWGDGECVCGGDLCGCPMCLTVLFKLWAGVRDPELLWPMSVTISAWSGEDGAVIVDSMTGEAS